MAAEDAAGLRIWFKAILIEGIVGAPRAATSLQDSA
jgi:hypothetical protein